MPVHFKTTRRMFTKSVLSLTFEAILKSRNSVLRLCNAINFLLLGWICVTLLRSEVLVIFTFLLPKGYKLEVSAHANGVNSPSVADFGLLSQHHLP